jgi:predicted  nucleic acid-binding Zn-ribbon protein
VKNFGRINMTLAKQLHSLQELDLALSRVNKQKARAEKELAYDPGIEKVKTALQKENEQLLQVQSQHRLQQLESESQRERSARLDEQLYGGTVTNPRDLESLQPEASHARELLEQQDAQLLELTIQSDESQSKRDSLENDLASGQAAWDIRQEELRREIERLTEETESVTAQRNDLAATLDPASLQHYDQLRQSKGGLAVAKVERGLCQACRMSLPTQQQQRVRSGRQTVLCSSCGRILCLG